MSTETILIDSGNAARRLLQRLPPGARDDDAAQALATAYRDWWAAAARAGGFAVYDDCDERTHAALAAGALTGPLRAMTAPQALAALDAAWRNATLTVGSSR